MNVGVCVCVCVYVCVCVCLCGRMDAYYLCGQRGHKGIGTSLLSRKLCTHFCHLRLMLTAHIHVRCRVLRNLLALDLNGWILGERCVYG